MTTLDLLDLDLRQDSKVVFDRDMSMITFYYKNDWRTLHFCKKYESEDIKADGYNIQNFKTKDYFYFYDIQIMQYTIHNLDEDDLEQNIFRKLKYRLKL